VESPPKATTSTEQSNGNSETNGEKNNGMKLEADDSVLEEGEWAYEDESQATVNNGDSSLDNRLSQMKRDEETAARFSDSEDEVSS